MPANRTKYQKNIDRAQERADAIFQDLDRIIDFAYEQTIDFIIKENPQPNAELQGKLQGFSSNLTRDLTGNSIYQEKATSFISSMSDIKDVQRGFYSSNKKIDFDAPDLNEFQKAVLEEIIDQLTASGLNTNFTEPLRRVMHLNITAGLTGGDLRKVLEDYIKGADGKLGKLRNYLYNTTRQASAAYTGAINYSLNKKYKFDGFIVSGTLRKTSSTQCIGLIGALDNNGFISNKDMEKILVIARNNPKARLIPGTDLINLPLKLLHWGCYHTFTPAFKI